MLSENSDDDDSRITTTPKSDDDFFSKKDQTLYEIFNGFNSRNQFLARFLWFIKKRLPKKYFGLKDELIISKN